jgi:soluble lytic murein transglycosylase-like protein
MTGVVRTIIWATAVMLVVAVDASAQIYMGRDAAGTIVLSDRPLESDVVTFAVQRSGYRATRSTTTGAHDSVSLYDELIERHAADHGIRSELVRAVIQVESGFNARARSVKGAMGLMQLMPATAHELGVGNPWDPSENIRGGVAYLAGLLRRFNDERLALAAYNAGPGAVERYGLEVPPYRETQEYVRKIAARTDVMADAGGGRRPIYKVWEVVDGREVMRLTDVRPVNGSYEVLPR